MNKDSAVVIQSTALPHSALSRLSHLLTPYIPYPQNIICTYSPRTSTEYASSPPVQNTCRFLLYSQSVIIPRRCSHAPSILEPKRPCSFSRWDAAVHVGDE